MTSVTFWCCVGIAIMATTQAAVVALLLAMYYKQKQSLENWTLRFSHRSRTGWPCRMIQNLFPYGQNNPERTTNE